MTLATIHALMGAEDRWINNAGGYSYWQLKMPIGAMENPLADYNFDAGTAGWRPTEHSDHKDLEYHRIYSWYKQFLASPGAGTGSGPTALPIGVE